MTNSLSSVYPDWGNVNLLAGAQNFTIENVTLLAQIATSDSEVLRLLAKKAMPSAMLDSTEQAYSPMCGTKEFECLRTTLVDWGTTESQTRRILWLSGPSRAGTSALAQTVAGDFDKMDRLGATFHFHNVGHRDRLDALIPTIAYQLAMVLPKYKHIVIQRLTNDPLILDKNHRVQFRELIVKPFQILMEEREGALRQELIIVIDGFDKCKSRTAQREVVELIGSHDQSVADIPLRWMVCSRPESHLKAIFSSAELETLTLCESLDLGDANPARCILPRRVCNLLGRAVSEAFKAISTKSTVRWRSTNRRAKESK